MTIMRPGIIFAHELQILQIYSYVYMNFEHEIGDILYVKSDGLRIVMNHR